MGEFQIKIASTGDVFDVPESKSILHVLVENGYTTTSSCAAGLCGVCRVRYIEGVPDHRDMVLDAEEQTKYLTTCVSRAHSQMIVLDLPAKNESKTGFNINLEKPLAVVDQSICVACLTCVRACAFGAAFIDPDLQGVGGIMGAARIEKKSCTGCGLCAAACPTGAIDMTRFTDQEVNLEVENIFENNEIDQGTQKLQVVIFSCATCLTAVEAFTNQNTGEDCPKYRAVNLPCSGRIDNLHVMKAFEDGADGVIIAGCPPSKCNYKSGNTNAERRVRRIEKWLENLNLSSNRIQMVYLPPNGVKQFARASQEFNVRLSILGTNPIRDKVG